jgi:hypothetical protein
MLLKRAAVATCLSIFAVGILAWAVHPHSVRHGSPSIQLVTTAGEPLAGFFAGLPASDVVARRVAKIPSSIADERL